MKSLALTALPLILVGGLASCTDPSCGAGKERVGDQCREITSGAPGDGGDADASLLDGASVPEASAMQDAGAPLGEGDAAGPAPCGNGRTEAGEACDDAARAAGDGCSATCQLEAGFSCRGEPSACLSIPAAPSIEGESDAGYSEVSWTFSRPVGTSRYRVRLDAGAPESVSDSVLTRSLSAGEHTLQVSACNEHAVCGPSSAFVTTVTLHGTDYPALYRGVSRPLPRTALGHVCAVACHDCATGPDGEILARDAARAAVERAVQRGADLIDVDVVEIDGTLYVSRDDTATPADRPRLFDVLSTPALLASDALVLLEIRETSALEASFAARFASTFDMLPELWKNGRPLFVHATEAREGYVRAIREAAGPIRTRYLKSLASFTTTKAYAAFVAELPDVSAAGHLGVILPHTADNLFGRMAHAKAAGLAVAIGPVPGPDLYGQVALLGLREQAELFVSDYRVDQARALVTAKNGAGYLDVRELDATATGVTARVIIDGAVATYPQMLGTAPSASAPGTPSIREAEGVGLFGGTLDFTASASTELTLWSTAIAAAASEGYFVSAATTLPAVMFGGATNEWLNVVGTCAGTSGLCLQFHTGSASTQKRVDFAVAPGGTQATAHYALSSGSDPACPAAARFTDTLDSAERGLWLAGLRPAHGPAVLFIDGRCAAVQAATGSLTASGGKTRVGSGKGGLIQVADVQLAPDMSEHARN
jgi:cysteine-rich repeat protein